MSANSEPFDITSDSEVLNACRVETQYDESKLSASELHELLRSAKRDVALMADVTQFYSDRGTAVALLGVLCIKAKSAVENQAVSVKNLGPDDVTFRTTDGSSLQVTKYEQMTQRGLANADNTDAGTSMIRFTHDYNHGDIDPHTYDY